MILEYIVEEDSIVLKDYLAKIRLPRNFRSGQNKEHLFFFVNNQEVANYYRLKKGDKLVIVASEKDKDDNCQSGERQSYDSFEDEYFSIVENAPVLPPSRPESITTNPLPITSWLITGKKESLLESILSPASICPLRES